MERNFTLIILFAALICALGFVPPITLISGVPISAQSLGVMLAGAVLGAGRGALAVVVVVGLVALGLPVLAGGRGGLGVFAGPTVGFLLGWIAAAFVTGWVVSRLQTRFIWLSATIAAVIGGIVVLYLCGTIGMMIVLHKTFGQALLLSLPFIPGDLIKAVVVGWLTAMIGRYRPGALLSRAH
ncbi:MAG TPA: biotin transporter BioY [Paenirhodobacter sp.]